MFQSKIFQNFILQKKKFYLQHLSRKSGSKELFTDIYNRMYMDSSPEMRRFRPKKRITKPPAIPTDDDLLVQRFIADEHTIPWGTPISH